MPSDKTTAVEAAVIVIQRATDDGPQRVEVPVPFGYDDAAPDIQWMAAFSTLIDNTGDSDAVYRQLDEQIQAATNEDEILGGNDVLNMKRDQEALVGIPFRLMGVNFQRSEVTTGLPIYGVLHVQFSGGDLAVITAGGRTVINQARRFWELNLFPSEAWMTFRQDHTSAGYDVYRLVKAKL